MYKDLENTIHFSIFTMQISECQKIMTPKHNTVFYSKAENTFTAPACILKLSNKSQLFKEAM